VYNPEAETVPMPIQTQDLTQGSAENRLLRWSPISASFMSACPRRAIACVALPVPSYRGMFVNDLILSTTEQIRG
jgi:hypothetical protein